MSVRWRLRQSERGSIAPLVLIYLVIVLLVILGGVVVTSAQLTRMSLLDVADAAALAAADGGDQVYGRNLGRQLTVTDESVQRDAAAYLAARHKPGRITDWSLGPRTGAPSATTTQVELTGTADLPVFGSVLRALGSDITITVRSQASAQVR